MSLAFDLHSSALPLNPSINWSEQQIAFIDWAMHGKGSCVLEAVAGAGKTTTLLEAARLINGRVAICAFNKAIADEISGKLEKQGLSKKIDARTAHSFGFKALRLAFPKIRMVNTKVRSIFREMFDKESVQAKWEDQVLKLVGMAKQRAIGVARAIEDDSAWLDIIDAYDILALDDGIEPIALANIARLVLDASNSNTRECDFNDMIYMPLLYKARFFQYDVLFIDEAQDTNAARRLLYRAMLKKNGRCIAVGDQSQAIYGFAGADNDSLDQIAREFKAVRLPLTVSYRCPKSVVAFARQWSDKIEAAPTAKEGVIETVALEDLEQFKARLVAGSAVLCRNTKPLVELFFKLLRNRIPARVEGRDVAAGLIKLATKWERIKTIPALEDKLDEYFLREKAKLVKEEKEHRVAYLEDSVESLKVIAAQCRDEGKTRVSDIVDYLNTMFADDVSNMLVLSTIHRSKGREWTTVFWLDRANLCPSPYARQPWQQEQEGNLCYVAATRSLDTLIEVTVPAKRRD